jgi:4'-phosphopantetheinyl transferase
MMNLEIQWGRPSSSWSLKEAETHLWAATLDVSSEVFVAYLSTLSSSEKAHAQRFHFQRDQKHFIVGRGTLRAILASYLMIKPELLHIKYGSRGKPILANLPDEHTLHFNLAHSDGLFLLAVSRHFPVGVDVEHIRLLEKPNELVERFFSPTEAIELHGLPDHQRTEAFFRLWTRKEACLKATGEGISERLNEIAVSFLANQPARVLKPHDGSQPGGAWTLKDLNPAPGYVAALAAAVPDLVMSCWQWSR